MELGSQLRKGKELLSSLGYVFEQGLSNPPLCFIRPACVRLLSVKISSDGCYESFMNIPKLSDGKGNAGARSRSTSCIGREGGPVPFWFVYGPPPPPQSTCSVCLLHVTNVVRKHLPRGRTVRGGVLAWNRTRVGYASGINHWSGGGRLPEHRKCL